MNLRKEIVFGLVSRVITDDGNVIDLVFAMEDSGKRYPALVVNEKIFPITDVVEFGKWIPVSLVLSKKEKKLKMYYGANQLTVALSLNNSKKIKVSLGLCHIEPHAWADVAPVNIKDVKIFHEKKLIRHWELKQHKDNICYDKVNHVPATARNPYWLINDHFQWKKIYSLNRKRPIQVAFNPKGTDFYITEDQQILKFDPIADSTISIPVLKGFQASNLGNQLLYDTISDRLVSYSLGDNIASFFSFNDRSWTSEQHVFPEPHYENHSYSYSSDGKMVYMFGGYGFYQYKNDFFKLDISTGKTEKKALPDIMPRFSTASALVGNSLYFFGGRGNKMGRQELSPRTFYDLYSVDLTNLKVRKLWESTKDINDLFIPGANMIYNESDNSFYAITTESGGILIKIFLESSEWKYVSGPMREPMYYKDMFFNLYYSPSHQKLYTVFNKILKDGSYQLSIYSLNFPPMDVNAVGQESEKRNMVIWIIIGSILILCFLAAFLYFKKLRKRKEELPENDLPETYVSGFTEEEGVTETYFDRSKSSISLLGSFNVRNKDGEDITNNFTPRLKNMLILLILYSEKNERGIVEKKLDDFLWSDKSEDSARNNRNVSLRKLRVLLEQVGDVEILNDNQFRKIIIGEGTFCDYNKALQYMAEAKSAESKNEEFLNKLLELLLFGPLLPNTSADWLDDFKGNYSSSAIDLLGELLKNDSFKHHTKFRLKIAETIISHDMLNEEALIIKCTILYNTGKKGLAKTAYDSFCREYKKSLGEDYKMTFTSICEKTVHN
ncbi:MAG: hypothetical protein PHS30_07220 [Bacteroidales bacterium]|nr:hypothetical protein [Bacteroidales bacterium]